MLQSRIIVRHRQGLWLCLSLSMEMTQDWFSCYLYRCAVSLCSHIDIFWSKCGPQWPWFECNFPQQKKDVNSMRNYKYSKFEFRGWISNLKPLSWCLKSLHLPNISKGMSCFTHIDIIVLTFARGNFVSNCNIIVCISKHPTIFSIWHTHESSCTFLCPIHYGCKVRSFCAWNSNPQ